MSKRQRIFTITAIVGFLISSVVVIVLVTALSIAEKRLAKIGATMDEMATLHIVRDILVEESIPLKQNINVTDDIMVNIDMTVETEIPFTAMIPVNQELLVPIRIGIKDFIRIDTTINISDVVHIDVNDTIPLDQRLKIPIFSKKKKKGISIPVYGEIPLHQQLNVSFNEAIPIHALVPLDMVVIDTMPIGLVMKIPVDIKVPIRLPIKQTAKIGFSGALPVDTQVPIKMVIPVDIPLEETSLAAYFRKMAHGLRGLTKMSLSE
ncbi:MAG: hypothetical protein V4638_10840 [Bacteroidota bacterium]